MLADRDITADDIRRLFDRITHDMAFLPYYPEMMDFELDENNAAELRELDEYTDSFAARSTT